MVDTKQASDNNFIGPSGRRFFLFSESDIDFSDQGKTGEHVFLISDYTFHLLP
jgi:hypothetical protein